jgi:hypothetical protein
MLPIQHKPQTLSDTPNLYISQPRFQQPIMQRPHVLIPNRLIHPATSSAHQSHLSPHTTSYTEANHSPRGRYPSAECTSHHQRTQIYGPPCTLPHPHRSSPTPILHVLHNRADAACLKQRTGATRKRLLRVDLLQEKELRCKCDCLGCSCSFQ